MSQDFSAVVPQSLEVWGQKREFFCLVQARTIILFVMSLFEEGLIDGCNFLELGIDFFELVSCQLFLRLFFPTVIHFL